MPVPIGADPLQPVLDALARQAQGGPSSDFDLNPGTIPEGMRLRPAAVLVPLMLRQGEVRVVLTKRSSRLRHHPGQIAFPGGKLEEIDLGLEAAALRESHEEIGLDPGNVEILGKLPAHRTITGFMVTPVVGRVRAPFAPIPEAGEVDEVFDVPLAHVVNPAMFQVQARHWRGVERHYYAVPWGPYYIWGATARILRTLAERMAP